jgi:hypothetical protein
VENGRVFYNVQKLRIFFGERKPSVSSVVDVCTPLFLYTDVTSVLVDRFVLNQPVLSNINIEQALSSRCRQPTQQSLSA